jgi:hypothetical protein
MIKRLLIIGALTGAAHLTTIIVLKILTGSVGVSVIKTVGELDSIFNLVINILAAGLLISTIREIVIAGDDDWKKVYIESQRARVSLGLLLLVICLVGIYNQSYFLLVAAPIFAFHGDYALYGRGLPVFAAVLTFLRVFIPSLTLLIFSQLWPEFIIYAFAISTLFMYVITGVIISSQLSVPYFVRPSFTSLFLYLKTVNGGIISFGYYFFGLGLIILGGFFFEEKIIAIAYVAAKLYIIYKGVLRILNQSFFNDLKDISMCNKVDYLATLAGVILLVATSMFPAAFQEFFIDEKLSSNPYWVTLFGIAGFVISPFTSFTSKAMLEKKDKQYAFITILALLISSAVCVGCYFLKTDETGLLISLAVGELTCVIGLIRISGSTVLIKKRFYFILRILPLVIIPFGVKYLAGDTTIAMIASLIVFGTIALLLNRQAFKLELSNK